jgi:hypothetical protein
MPETIPMHYAIARALCRLMPVPNKDAVDWLEIADEFVTSVADVCIVPREDYDRLVTSRRDALARVRELEETIAENDGRVLPSNSRAGGG